MVETGRHIDGGDTDQLAEGLIVRDAQGRILLTNRRMAEIYGLDPAWDVLGQTLPDLLDRIWTQDAGAQEAKECWADNSRFPGAPFELPLPIDRWVRVQARTY